MSIDNIDSNDIIDLNLLDFEGFRCNGYRQISKDLGVKTKGHTWGSEVYYNVSDLVKSYDWERAQKEYMSQKLAFEFHLAPPVFRLVSACTPLGLKPCIVMQHLEGYIGLEESFVCGLTTEEETSKIATDLNLSLVKNGYFHGDNHFNNILVKINDYNLSVVDAYMIDFEYMHPHNLQEHEYVDWVSWNIAETLAELS